MYICILSVASQVTLMVRNLSANAGDIREVGSIPGIGRSPGERHGNPLQYSCLENPMYRGAWWATVHRVVKSLTQLKWLSMHVHDLEWPHQSGPPEWVGNPGTWTLSSNGKWYALFSLQPLWKLPREGKGCIVWPQMNGSHPGKAEPSNGTCCLSPGPNCACLPSEPRNFLYCLSFSEVVLFHLEH